MRRQRSEQYSTASQTAAHFLRQTNGRPQARQVRVGRSAFFTVLSPRLTLPLHRASVP